MDILVILADAMERNEQTLDDTSKMVCYDLNNKHIIRSIYAIHDRPYASGEQCGVLISKKDCEVAGFYLYNVELGCFGETVYLDEYPEVAPRYRYIYEIICRELVHGDD